MKLYRKFVQWFYDDVYAEPNHNRNGWMQEYSDLQHPDHRNYWMLQSFLAGAVEGRQLSIYLIKQELNYHLQEGNLAEASAIEDCIYKIQHTEDYK